MNFRIKIVVFSLLTIFTTGCTYTKLINKSFSDKITGTWKQNITGQYDPRGWGRRSITFSENNIFCEIYLMEGCSYVIKNDTLVVCDQGKLDSTYFKINFKDNILLILSPLDNENNKFKFLNGVWNWW